MLRGLLIAATVVVGGCPSATPPPAHPALTTADLNAFALRIARAEVTRAAGVAGLVELATHGEPWQRTRALAALGRIGGAKAMQTIEAAIEDADPAVAEAALGGLGVAASLDDEVAPSPSLARVSATLARSPEHHDKRMIEMVVEADGRAGGASQQEDLAILLRSPEPEVVASCAIALGRYGRRKIALRERARAALVMTTHHQDASVRFAAVYALAREFRAKDAPADRDVEGALAARITDSDAEVRATAISGLVRRNAVAGARAAIEAALGDPDWRVAVEAVRALAGELGDVGGRRMVGLSLSARASTSNEADAHVVLEALRALATHREWKAAWIAVSTEWPHVQPLIAGWIECLARAAQGSREDATDPFQRCTALDDHLALPILADLITTGAGTVAQRRAAMRTLLEHPDARVRAAGLGALAAMWKDDDANDYRTTLATLAAAIASPDPIIAGAAVDAATAIYELVGADRAVLDDAVVARATREREVELGASLFELIGKLTIAAGAAACRAALGDAAPVRARAAAECLKQLGEAVPVPPIAEATAPPGIDVAAVIGHHLWWRVVTTRGELLIALRPEVAPWNVATIVTLTRRGFFDGLEFHRVVPNFVVQGGDPTMSGWGGPGFTTPAEPSTRLDGDGFTRGAVGIADAGRDSGGSQWFVMHSRAPHLDGRYTWIGNVVAGQKSADALLIGDKIVRATIEDLPNGAIPAGVTLDPATP